MSKQRILFVVHNHPKLHPGGAEAYALEVYEGLREHGRFEPTLVARSGPNRASSGSSHPGTPFSMVGDDPNQYFAFTNTDGFDFFWMTHRDKTLYTKHFDALLRTLQPDIVHFQHTLFIGYDLISQVRQTLPDARILYTLHEFLAICHRDGQMVRTVGNEERCMEASPRRCSECFPSHSPQNFFMRKRFIQSHFQNVDLFLAPSRFLMERYIDWGIPRDRIRFEEYGRHRVDPLPAERADRPRDRIGFFGQLNRFKGINVLLQAMPLLRERVDARLSVHGANLELQPDEFQAEFASNLEAAADGVTLVGRYEHHDLPRLMADIDWAVVPSVWWENSPLVIQEAFQHRRPVICSDIGGMAEKVDDGVNGLHFRAGDPRSLADTLERAVTEPGLWERLREGIRPVYAMDDHIRALEEIYDELSEPHRAKEAIV